MTTAYSDPPPPHHDDDDDEEAQQQQQVVFTAVTLGNHDNIDTLKQQQQEEEANNNSLLASFKTYSILLGGIIGCFIQVSSLAANYYLASSSSSATTNHHHASSIVFSVIWSFFTSTLGVILMLGVRSMLPSPDDDDSHHNNKQMLLECYFAVGALAGVCLAWMGTDVALGMHQHMVHSTITLLLAVVWCKVLCLCVPAAVDNNRDDDDDDSQQNALTEPLLLSSTDTNSANTTKNNNNNNTKLCPFRVKTTGLFLGSLVGLFIQFSSLGANFFCQRLCENPVAFSLIWSFVTSTMGIVVLILIRGLLVASWDINGDNDSDQNSFLLLLHVECFFALGATLGLNLAWTVTDMVFGLESHILQSVCTLIGTLIWCKLVMFCCGYCRTESA